MKSDKEERIDPKLAMLLKETREKKGLTQGEVAGRAKVTETFYAMTERGESNPSLAKLNRMLKVLGLKILVKKA